jgi:hypothetical protein
MNGLHGLHRRKVMLIPNIESLKQDPVVIEYIKHQLVCEKNGVPINTATPMHALAEKRIAVLTASLGRFDQPPFPPDVLAIAFYNATVIHMDSDVVPLFVELSKKVEEAYLLAGDNTPSPKQLPFDLIWLTTEYGWSGISITGQVIGKPEKAYDAAFINSIATRHGSQDVTYVDIEAGKLVEVTASQSYRDALAIFLEQKITVVREETPNRQFRKEAKRLGLRHDESVRVLTLRPIDRQNGGSSDSDATRQYHHRWLVRGHIRNQWFPSRQQHELVWIDPHQKGPEYAPFKETVRHVVR